MAILYLTRAQLARLSAAHHNESAISRRASSVSRLPSRLLRLQTPIEYLWSTFVLKCDSKAATSSFLRLPFRKHGEVFLVYLSSRGERATTFSLVLPQTPGSLERPAAQQRPLSGGGPRHYPWWWKQTQATQKCKDHVVNITMYLQFSHTFKPPS